MFVSVGPAAFTCSGTIGMAQNLHRALVHENDPGPHMFMGMPADLAANILRIVANWASLWLWGLAIWFFFVSVISNIAPLYTHRRENSEGEDKDRKAPGYGHEVHTHKIPFAMTWFSYIFPQTALTTATFRVAEAFNVHALNILGCVMIGLLIALWVFVVASMIRAVMLKQIMWPEKGEDREEGGFVKPGTARKRAKCQHDVEEEAAQDLTGEVGGRDEEGASYWHWSANLRAQQTRLR